MSDIISEEKFREIKEKYLDKPGLSDAAVEEIRNLYSPLKYSKEIVGKLLETIAEYRRDNKELCDKLADAWFKK